MQCRATAAAAWCTPTQSTTGAPQPFGCGLVPRRQPLPCQPSGRRCELSRDSTGGLRSPANAEPAVPAEESLPYLLALQTGIVGLPNVGKARLAADTHACMRPEADSAVCHCSPHCSMPFVKTARRRRPTFPSAQLNPTQAWLPCQTSDCRQELWSVQKCQPRQQPDCHACRFSAASASPKLRSRPQWSTWTLQALSREPARARAWATSSSATSAPAMPLCRYLHSLRLWLSTQGGQPTLEHLQLSAGLRGIGGALL